MIHPFLISGKQRRKKERKKVSLCARRRPRGNGMDPFPHELFCGRRGAGEDGREAGCLFCGRGKQDGAGGRRREAGGGRREAGDAKWLASTRLWEEAEDAHSAARWGWCGNGLFSPRRTKAPRLILHHNYRRRRRLLLKRRRRQPKRKKIQKKKKKKKWKVESNQIKWE